MNTFSYNDDSLNITLSCSNSYPISGEEFNINLNFLPSEPINISAYRLKINFDSSKLSYKGLYSDINNDDFNSYVKDDLLTILYITSEKGIDLKANTSQVILELNFKVLSDCDIGTTKINASIDGLCDYDAEAIPLSEIDPQIVNIRQSGDGNCDLEYLSAGEYQISPKFSADITNYSVDVPYSKSTIEFEAKPLDENATVKANRKTLKSAGTPTDINLTVTSADKKSKKIYTVTVNRLSKNSNGIESDENNLIESYDLDENVNNQDINNTEEIDENVVKNNNIELQELSSPIVVKESSFNIFIFIIGASIFFILAFFILRNKQT